MKVLPFVSALVPLAWLVPNHYHPWPAAWSDALVLGLLTVAVLGSARGLRINSSWSRFVGIALIIVTGQFAFGLIPFLGDAAMSLLYLVAFAAAVALGQTTASPAGEPDRGLVNALALAMLAAAVLSVGIAAAQWTGTAPPSLWLVDKPPTQRPFGNVAQPNHFCTIAFLGLTSLGWLRQQNKVSSISFMLGGGWLLFGMAMSGSRTGWIQIGFLLFFLATSSSAFAQTHLRRQTALLVTCFVVLTLAWPSLNEWLLLQGSRLAGDIAHSGTRPTHWAAMVEAISRAPWLGYGWPHVAFAQWETSLYRMPIGEHIEHSHNLVLDLLVWSGVPLGGTLVLIAGIWFWTRFKLCRHHSAGWLYLGAAGLLIHSQLEYPLYFAYFLVPFGVLLGAIDAMVAPRQAVALGKSTVMACAVAFAGVASWIGVEYVQAEQAYRLLRLESAKIGVTGIETPPPPLRLLTQLGALIQFAQTPARQGMAPEELDQMRQVVRRYAFPPSMLRYALATALNSRHQEATDTLLRLCRIHPPARCAEGRESWSSAMTKFPAISVEFPNAALINSGTSAMPPNHDPHDR